MKITAFKNSQVAILALGLGLVFFGFNAAEQHLTAFYQSIGLASLAFRALAVLYAAIVVGSLIGPWVVNRRGIKPVMVLGYLAYAMLVFSLVLKQAWLIYALSFLLGLGSGAAGIARVEFLRLVAPVSQRGEFAGAIESVRTLGGSLAFSV